MILAKLKANALLILAGLTAVLAFLLKLSTARSARLKKKAETYKAQAHRTKVIMQKDVEIDEQAKSRRADLAKEIQDTGDTPVFSDPNRLRNNSRD